jgi:hypothetical protein
MIQKGYWVVLPLNAILLQPHLKLAPAGVVPQRERRPRPIMDYTYNGVHQNSLPLAPDTLQFGHTLTRILQRISYANPSHGPVQLLKLDLADGYYRIKLSPEAVLELAVVLPGSTPTHENLIGIPLVLPMGWKYSPNYFCAYTETCADLANCFIETRQKIPMHPLERPSQAITVPTSLTVSPNLVLPPTATSQTPLAYVDVYMDDFLGLAQRHTTDLVLRALLSSVSHIFRHDHENDPPVRKSVISQSKLLKGDLTWASQKTILGWLIDTAKGTLSLPPHKRDRFHQIIQHFLPLHRTSRRKWCQRLGELRSMASAIQGGTYLFSILQNLLVDHPTAPRLRLSKLVQHALDDWHELANSLAAHPVPIAALVPQAPAYIALVDASAQGLGGAWIPIPWTKTPCPPFVWRFQLPTHITSNLVTQHNPDGTITNSDLELAAITSALSILTNAVPDLQHQSLLCGSDNIAAVSWCRKGSTSSNGIRSHNFTLHPHFLPGHTNQLADFCSRSFHLQDDDFLAHVQCRFPIHYPWHHLSLSPQSTLTLNGLLSPQKSTEVYQPLAATPTHPPGSCGKHFAKPSTQTPSSNHSQTKYHPSLYSPTVIDMASFLPAAITSAVERWVMPFEPLARKWPSWD